MLFHGSPYEFSVGDTLLPGTHVGRGTNGGCSSFLYATGDFGYSMSNVDAVEEIHNIREYAIWDAALWGQAYGSETPSWVYAVEGDIVGVDDHMDVSPGSYKLSEGTILHAVPVVGENGAVEAMKSMYAWAQEYQPF